MKELKGVDENTVIHCSTQEEWDKVTEICEIEWNDGRRWESPESCISPRGFYADLKHYRGLKYILPAAEFIRLNTPEIPDNFRFGMNTEMPKTGVHELQSNGTGLSNTTFLGPSDGVHTKVEEREIIGYEPAKEFHAPFWNNVWTKNNNNGYSCKEEGSLTEHIHYEIFERMIEAGIFVPVYREKPVFKVGDWVIDNAKEYGAREVIMVTKVSLILTNGGEYTFSYCRLATPEEIEAARPKLVLKSYWELYDTKELLPLSVWDSEPSAQEELRKIAVVGKRYFVKEIQYLGE